MNLSNENLQKISLRNKLAFACGDIFGGGTFNLINFLFVPFLTLVVGLPMIWASPLLLLSKVWDGLIDPFIGKITDGKTPGKFGKRRYFLLIAAPIVFVALILLFFPWNLLTDSVGLKFVLVLFTYLLYATAQSFVLIPYYSLASEMTDNFVERNRVNAVRLVFSICSSLVCVAVPGMIASPTGSALTDGLGISASYGYIIMASIFGLIFAMAILITAIFAREKVITPPVRKKISLREFFKPLKLKTYRQYLGMQMCTSMAMAVMSSFFFVFCDFVLRKDSYFVLTTAATEGLGRFPIATIAAACMFLAQMFALPFYLKMIKLHGKRFSYILSGAIWAAMCLVVILLPAETAGSAQVIDNRVVATTGIPDWALLLVAFLLGFGLGGCVFIPHSSFGDVCDVGQLHFGERTEGTFSGLTNFLNTTAQAVGLSLPALIMGLPALGGYVETRYLSATEYAEILSEYGSLQALQDVFKISEVNGSFQLIPLAQSDASQLALRLTFGLLPILVILVGIAIACGFKLNKAKQEKIAALNRVADKTTAEFERERKEILESL